MKTWQVRACSTTLVLLSFCCALRAGISDSAKDKLNHLLLGKDVKPLLDLPATKEGINIYLSPEHGKRLDERGIDMKELTKFLKSKGVGVQAGEADIITDIRFDKDRVEVHIGGGGEGRRGSKHANKVSPGLLRAGGSRVNFRFGRDLTDEDIQPDKFLPLMARVLDVSAIRQEEEESQIPAQYKAAIQSKTVKEGMTYQMVLMAFGNPDQKKIIDSSTSLQETWYYLIDGHRWVVDFTDGKVSNVRVY
jgi:hypothetical protein